MIYLQFFHFSHYQTLSNNNRVKVVPIAPTRGLLYDRHQELLAENQSTFRLVMVPEQVKNVQNTLNRLKKLIALSDKEIAQFNKQRKQKRRFDSLIVKSNLTEQEVANFSVNKHLFPGTEVEPYVQRYYPRSLEFAHIIGYLGLINDQDIADIDIDNYRATRIIGRTGVENYYETALHGKMGQRLIEINAQGKTVRELESTAATPGQDLHLTVDSRLQKYAFEQLGEENGSVVMMQPKTGEVLVMASNPSFDTNQFISGIDQATYQSLLSDPRKPLFNRAMTGRFPPGSTIKPFVALAGLEHGVITPQLKIKDPGFYKLSFASRKYRDWKKQGHGTVDVHKAIVVSCDTYFYMLAHKLGIDKMHDFMTPFGFGVKTGIDIPGERQSLMPSREWKRNYLDQPWYPGETLIIGIGQGSMLVTPLQLAVSTSILANRGKIIKPKIVRQDINYVEKPRYIKLKNEQNWDRMFKAMEDSVHKPGGTAYRIGKHMTYRTAGKTGTAQVVGIPQGLRYKDLSLEKHLRDHGWFISFAPVDDPEIVFVSIIENAESGAALPVAKAMMDKYFELYGKK